MASSWVAVANAALIKLGTSTIISFDDGTKQANLAKLRYEEVRDIVLRMHPWNCAMSRVIMSPLVSTPAFEFSNEFQLPSDLLRVIEIQPVETPYKVEGRKLLADATQLDLKYIYRVTDPTQLDVLCTEAIACYLAYDICYALMQDAGLQDVKWSEFEKVLRRAKHADATEDSESTLQADDWDVARFNSSGLLRAHNSG